MVASNTLLLASLLISPAFSFLPPSLPPLRPSFLLRSSDSPIFTPTTITPETLPVPFHPPPSPVVVSSASPYSAVPIECLIEGSVAVDGTTYVIGTPFDHPVAICYFEGDSLVPVDEAIDGELMDRVFPLALSCVEDEYGEDFSLVRTAQTLTLVGDIDGFEEEEGGQEEEDGETFVNEDDGSEEVEMLFSFTHADRDYNLVRMLDPVLLVGARRAGDRVELLTDEEGESGVLETVEQAFLEAQEGEFGEQ